MKKTTILFAIVLLISQTIYSQPVNNKATYSIKLVRDFFDFDATLIFNSHKSFFVTKQHKGPVWFIDDMAHYNTQEIITDTIGYIVYRDFKTKKALVREFCKVKEPLVYEDNIEIKWELGDESKSIQGIKCKNAFTTFRGRRYEAWYAPEIPTEAGPWKFNGLPGLITKVHDTKGKISILIKSFNTKSNDKIDIKDLKINTTITEANMCLDKEWQKHRKHHALAIAKVQAEFPDVEISGSLPKTRVATEQSLVKKYEE